MSTVKPTKSAALCPFRHLLLGFVALVACVLVASARTAAQVAPPIDGVTGTVALEGTVVQEHATANTIAVKTMDGVEHLFHFTKDILVHGGQGSGVEALQGLRDGTTVAVHYTVAGSDASALEIDQISDDGLKVTEGEVTRIDRGRRQITIRFDNGKTEVFQLTEHAASGAGKDVDHAPDGRVRVRVYYTDDEGHKVAHFFKRTS